MCRLEGTRLAVRLPSGAAQRLGPSRYNTVAPKRDPSLGHLHTTLLLRNASLRHGELRSIFFADDDGTRSVILSLRERVVKLQSDVLLGWH